MRYLYTALWFIATPLIWIRLYLKGRKNPAYLDRIGERFGYYLTQPLPQSIWVHAVSVGETIATLPLIEALIKKYPTLPIVVTSMTPTGSDQVKKHLGDRVAHVYLPYEFPNAIKRFLDHMKPKIGIIMETELWPNLLHIAHTQEIPLLIANARLSKDSYTAYKRIAPFVRQILGDIDLVCAQSDADAKRFTALGAACEKVKILGNLKFDMTLPKDLLQQGQQLNEAWGARPILIAASTHEGEDEIVLDAFSEVHKNHPNLLLVLVPRHPERFEKVYELCQARGFLTQKRSKTKDEALAADTQILLGDTMGEMRLFYAASSIAFVGGSLKPIGGHNLLEPAACALPILSGPHLKNFTQISQLLKKAKALCLVNNAKELAKTACELLNDEARKLKMGQAAMGVVAENQGALNKHLNEIHACLKENFS